MGMYTDPSRITADTPGQVDGNPVFIYHDAFNSNHAEVAELKDRYRRGKVGDVEVKKILARSINEFLDPIRKRRTQLEMDTDMVNDILAQGTRYARAQALETMDIVRAAMGITNYLHSEVKQASTAHLLQQSAPVKGLAYV